MPRAVIVMAKEPRPGTVKTRLIPALGAGGAAGLYRAFLADVLDTVAGIAGVERYLYVQPPGSLAWFEPMAAGRFQVRAQSGPSLAERIVNAFADLFDRGIGPVVMRNSDSPTLPAGFVVEALSALERGADVVLGPDRGGGYYLVGLRAPQPRLFRDVAMGTTSVLEETQRRARELSLEVHLLEPWLDVDEPADLDRLREELDPARRVERALCERTEAFLATLRPDSSGSLRPAGRLQQPFPSPPAVP
jgi:rSAM/selenodomain-associated transferase 1